MPLVVGTHHRILDLLVVVEIGLALMLMIGAGLFVRNLLYLNRVSPGFDPKNALTMKVSLPEVQYPGYSDRIRFMDAALEKVSKLPGVKNAAAINILPMAGGWQYQY